MVAYQKSASGAEFVVSVIHNGKPIREFNEAGRRVCRIPFDSEYKIRVKSKTWKKALVSVSIDGTDVLTGGKQVILNPYQTVELERFVDDLNSGRKFKFISVEKGVLTGEIQDPTSADNGLIRVQIYPEAETTTTFTSTPDPSVTHGHTSTYFFRSGIRGQSATSGSVLRGASTTFAVNNASPTSYSTNAANAFNEGLVSCASDFGKATTSLSDLGATAEGSHSEQRFNVSTVSFATEAVPVTFDLWLKGVRSEIRNTCADLIINPREMTANFMGALHRMTSFEITASGAVVKTIGGAVITNPSYVIENS